MKPLKYNSLSFSELWKLVEHLAGSEDVKAHFGGSVAASYRS